MQEVVRGLLPSAFGLGNCGMRDHENQREARHISQVSEGQEHPTGLVHRCEILWSHTSSEQRRVGRLWEGSSYTKLPRGNQAKSFREIAENCACRQNDESVSNLGLST